MTRILDPQRLATLVAGFPRRPAYLGLRQALQAVDSGSYGECNDCGEAISPKRLAAMPWAIRCVECQRKFEGSSRFAA